ncbi:hypothetical protein [Glycomyces rhizosphaerae]|uniref:Uncharacterized protein n=1 Tax=Glycomyces rhizosphaerae TaxID=2054422 RepID=A0ABV7Q3B4_9ACTN
MGFPLLLKRIGIAAAVLALTAAAGCSWFEEPEEDLDFAAYEGRLTDMYNESNRLTAELDESEARIIQDCLEEQGFTLHDPGIFNSMVPPETDNLLGAPPYDTFLPTVEEAERRGFWQWAALDGAEDFDAALYAEHEAELQAELALSMGEELAAEMFTDELDEFYLQDPADQFAWYVAYGGDTWAAAKYPDLGGPGTKTDASGEGVYVNPPPEGCLLEMVEAVYGEFQASENEEEGWTDWLYRPEPPNGDGQAMHERYAERTADAEGPLLDCLADRGSTGWEFQNDRILVREYLVAAGETVNPADIGTETTGPWPEVPEEVPDVADVEAWLAFERDLAADFAACGDESGFREAADHAWEQAQLRYYLDIEDETYAWQEEMRGYLANAQEVIEG